jgi:O-acetyl-ADP-ribose deacetylase (regulator of RNase III)
VAKGPIRIGEAVATGAGRLKARYVIHAAVMGQDLRTDADKVRRATEATLRRADELGIASIAFPALGTGVGGFPLGECARIMLDAVEAHAAGAGLQRSSSCLRPGLQAFQRERGAPAAARRADRGARRSLQAIVPPSAPLRPAAGRPGRGAWTRQPHR